jgi:hypothetical protein
LTVKIMGRLWRLVEFLTRTSWQDCESAEHNPVSEKLCSHGFG